MSREFKKMSTDELRAERDEIMDVTISRGHACFLVHNGDSDRWWALNAEIKRRELEAANE
jgi:hypothetical protein